MEDAFVVLGIIAASLLVQQLIYKFVATTFGNKLITTMIVKQYDHPIKFPLCMIGGTFAVGAFLTFLTMQLRRKGIIS